MKGFPCHTRSIIAVSVMIAGIGLMLITAPASAKGPGAFPGANGVPFQALQQEIDDRSCVILAAIPFTSGVLPCGRLNQCERTRCGLSDLLTLGLLATGCATYTVSKQVWPGEEEGADSVWNVRGRRR